MSHIYFSLKSQLNDIRLKQAHILFKQLKVVIAVNVYLFFTSSFNKFSVVLIRLHDILPRHICIMKVHTYENQQFYRNFSVVFLSKGKLFNSA